MNSTSRREFISPCKHSRPADYPAGPAGLHTRTEPARSSTPTHARTRAHTQGGSLQVLACAGQHTLDHARTHAQFSKQARRLGHTTQIHRRTRTKSQAHACCRTHAHARANMSTYRTHLRTCTHAHADTHPHAHTHI
jgi:hypothetical protein